MKLTTSREPRGALPAPILSFPEGDALIIINEGTTSIVRGPVRAWIQAHLDPQGAYDATYVPAVGGAEISLDQELGGGIVHIQGWPPVTPPTAGDPPLAPPIGPPPPSTPPADIPRPPETVDDWRRAISLAEAITVPPLPPVEPEETVATYAARALGPLGLTLAAVAKSGGLAALVPTPHDMSWDPILAAAGGITP